jgi:hypothetical protein
MDIEQILKMEAGPEIDACIAGKIMGWKDVRITRENIYPDPLLRPEWVAFSTGEPPEGIKYLDFVERANEAVFSDDKKSARVDVLPYSSSILLAWEVRDKLLETHHGITVGKNKDDGEYCLFQNEPSSPVVEASTAALAICKLALISVIQEMSEAG